MGLFGNKARPNITGEMKLSDIVPNYDFRMASIVDIGKCLYRGYLPDSALGFQDFGYLRGFHDYQVYTKRQTKKKRRKTLQVPKFTTEYLAKLIYTEKVTVNLTSESQVEIAKNLQSFIDDVVEENDYWTNTQGLTETMFNMGGKVEKPTIKDGKIFIEFITADKFYPLEWDNKVIYSGLFVNTFMKNGYYYTKLSWYERKKNDEGIYYRVMKDLYKSNDKLKVGDKVPYNSVFEDPMTMNLTGFTSIPFTYTKTRIKNNQVLQSPLGLPLWFNAIDVIADIDLIFDTKFREVRYGGRQKVVPAYAMKQKIKADGKGGKEFDVVYDPDDETISSFNLDPNEKTGVQDLTSPIRIEFIELLNQSLDIFAIETGFSTGTFVFNGVSMKTATEVITEKESTFQTKVNQERALGEGHKNLFLSCLEYAIAFELDERVKTIPSDLEIKIEFDDSIILDNKIKREEARLEVQQGLRSDWNYLTDPIAGRGLSEEEALEEQLKIENKKTQALQEAFGFGETDDDPEEEEEPEVDNE